MKKRSVVIVLLLAGMFALAASAQTWVTVNLDPQTVSQPDFEVSGSRINAALTPVAVAVLALALALTLAGKVFRYVLGAISLALGIALVLVGTGRGGR